MQGKLIYRVWVCHGPYQGFKLGLDFSSKNNWINPLRFALHPKVHEQNIEQVIFDLKTFQSIVI